MIDITHKDVVESQILEIYGYEFVKVVRCKDCSKRHGEIQNCRGELLYYFCGNGTHEPNWFCADGERKE